MFTIAKTHDAQRLVFGWANVAVGADNCLVTDRHNHQIDPVDLELAAYAFVLQFRTTGEMHQGDVVGALIESCVITPEKLAAMGLQATEGLPGAAWWVGFQLTPDAFAKVKDGTFTMFSIQGTADLERV
jgi:hypothetical protein